MRSSHAPSLLPPALSPQTPPPGPPPQPPPTKKEFQKKKKNNDFLKNIVLYCVLQHLVQIRGSKTKKTNGFLGFRPPPPQKTNGFQPFWHQKLEKPLVFLFFWPLICTKYCKTQYKTLFVRKSLFFFYLELYFGGGGPGGEGPGAEG